MATFEEVREMAPRRTEQRAHYMYKTLRKERLNSVICKMVLEAPHIAKKAAPGQFVILRIDQKGERIPLTICDLDRGSGTITIIFQEVGKTTVKLGTLEEGYKLVDLVGPLGRPTKIAKYGKVLVVGGGVGAAEVYPIAKALKQAGNNITIVAGARTKELLILEEELRKECHHLYITTDDGSYGFAGNVGVLLKELLPREDFDIAFAIGPVVMMKAVSQLTRPHNLKTMVSLNSIMVDGTGMCGTCRVSVGGKTKFTCVDGPEFDGHQVDFDQLMVRQDRFLKEEKMSLETFKHKCKLRNQKPEQSAAKASLPEGDRNQKA